jgi:hypothetical protein
MYSGCKTRLLIAFNWAGTRLFRNLFRLVEPELEGRLHATAKVFFWKGAKTAV